MNKMTSMMRLARRAGLAIFYCLASSAILMPSQSGATDMPRVEGDGTIHVPAFVLPESSFLSRETRAVLKEGRESPGEWAAAERDCPPMDGANRADMPAIRECLAEALYGTAFYKGVRDQYPVAMTPQEIRGVHTEVFTPADGVARKNRHRVLINLHGGGFIGGARTFSHLESIPIASVGKIKVISIDYRMAPEHTFPAASEDVADVYRELLKRYRAESIGIYGCSTGGALTAQAMAWFQREKLPLPGAIGMLCQGADSVSDGVTSKWVRSDAAYLGGALAGQSLDRGIWPYYQGVDRTSALASPGDHDEIMAKFPSSLLISATRDFLLSSVVVTHAQLTRLGVEADLHVWEGLSHAFHLNPSLPESREAYDVIVRFFDKHLRG